MQKKPTKKNTRWFFVKLENLILDPFWALLAQKPQNRIFFSKNQPPPLFKSDETLTSCKKSDNF